MRVLIELLETIIEGDVIGGEPLNDGSGDYDLDGVFTVRCEDGVCFNIHGWMVDTQILDPSTPLGVEQG